MFVEPQPSTAAGILSDGPPSWSAGVLACVRHGFFGRRGGFSGGIYESLNAGLGSNDDAACVRENRRRIAAAFGARPDHLLGVHQVHSSNAIFVSEPWRGDRPHADALVTTSPGLVISVLTADCAPVLFVDAQVGVIGAAHAGWKGALGGVLESTLTLMEEHGAERSRIAAAVGPCIHQGSYEVGPEFKQRFVESDASYASFFVSPEGDRLCFDLPGFCAARLQSLGLDRVDVLPLDTYTRPYDFFSHRRSVHAKESDYGRNCAAIALV